MRGICDYQKWVLQMIGANKEFLGAIIWANFYASLLALIALSAMFGILTGSFLAFVMFPIAILSMAREYNPVGIWIVASFIILLGKIVHSRVMRIYQRR